MRQSRPARLTESGDDKIKLSMSLVVEHVVCIASSREGQRGADGKEV